MTLQEPAELAKKNSKDPLKEAERLRKLDDTNREKAVLEGKIKDFTKEISELEGQNKLLVSESLREALEYVNCNRLKSKNSDSILKEHFSPDDRNLLKLTNNLTEQAKALVVDIMKNLPDNREETQSIVYALLLANYKPDGKIGASTHILPPVDGGKFTKYYMRGLEKLSAINIYVPDRLEGRVHSPEYKNLLARLFTLKVFTHFQPGNSGKIYSSVHNAMFKELSEQYQALLARKFRNEEPTDKAPKRNKVGKGAKVDVSSEEDRVERKNSKKRGGKKRSSSTDSSTDEEKKHVDLSEVSTDEEEQ